MDFLLTEDFYENDRGNSVFCRDEGMVAWISLKTDFWLEISWQPENYPSLDVQTIKKTEEELVKHINNELVGWYCKKCNLTGVKLNKDNEVVDEVKVEEEE